MSTRKTIEGGQKDAFLRRAKVKKKKGFNMISYITCNNFGYLSTDDRLKGNDNSNELERVREFENRLHLF